jgi:hypothetical protein
MNWNIEEEERERAVEDIRMDGGRE